MKNCSTCGAAAPDDERVCPHCGNPFALAEGPGRVVQLKKHRERKEREEARRYWQQQRRRAQAMRRNSNAWQIWSASPATIVLMALTLVVSIAVMVGGLRLVFGSPILQPVVLIFANPGLLGLLLSLLFLYFVGGTLERSVPLVLFLVVFFGSGLIGGYAETALHMEGVGLAPSLWGMVGALYMWERLRGAGGYAAQWLTGSIVFTLVLNLFMLNFNIGALLVQIVLSLAIGVGIVYLWVNIPGTRHMR